MGSVVEGTKKKETFILERNLEIIVGITIAM